MANVYTELIATELCLVVTNPKDVYTEALGMLDQADPRIAKSSVRAKCFNNRAACYMQEVSPGRPVRKGGRIFACPPSLQSTTTHTHRVKWVVTKS